eukprot:Phypoly_transcript_08525.p1 GENE.Phypoly_transcript_08525~~Phypoly_transcript_08525.p1  ORF type:complete len:450 (+),score=74.07 Phypoly_transcript_08525:120-1469(+)
MSSGTLNGLKTLAKVNFDAPQQHPKNFWRDKENQKAYLAWLASKINFTKLEDWYQLSNSHFQQFHGTGLLNHYKNSPSQLVTHLFPDHDWKLWMFKPVPFHFWVEAENVKSYMGWLSEKLGFVKMDDWYKIKQAHFIDTGGAGLLAKYNYSPTQIINTVFPEHEWVPWKFDFPPRNLWQEDKNRKKYMAWLGDQLGYTSLQDWYKTKQSDFLHNQGKTLLSLYSYSPRVAITSIFPAHAWEMWRFGGKYQTLGHDVGDPTVTAKYRNFVEARVKPLCKVEAMEDWYRVSHEDMERVGKKALVRSAGGLTGLLRRAYPEHAWDWSKFSQLNRKKGQMLMRSVIADLFSGCKIFEDYVHPTLIYKHNSENVQLDIFIPDLKLAFEYQGPHHYQRDVFFTNLSEGDLMKTSLCESIGLTLIAVPYWWDKKITSLGFLIHKVRPDLLQQFGTN